MQQVNEDFLSILIPLSHQGTSHWRHIEFLMPFPAIVYTLYYP